MNDDIVDVDNEGAPGLQKRDGVGPRKSREKKSKHGASGEKYENLILHGTSATTGVSGGSDDDKDHRAKNKKVKFVNQHVHRQPRQRRKVWIQPNATELLLAQKRLGQVAMPPERDDIDQIINLYNKNMEGSASTISSQILRHFQRFNGQYLSDQNINWYMDQLRRRDDCFRRMNTAGHKCILFFGTHFYTRMFPDMEESTNTNRFKDLEKWGGRQKNQDRDIFSESRVLVPINYPNNHWTLGVFYMEEKRLTIYDSLGEHDENAVNNLWRFLDNEYRSKTNQGLPGDWVYERDHHTPLQLNSYDCGVFICLYADFLSLNLPLIFDAEYLPNIRLRFAKLAIEEHANFSDNIHDSVKIKKAWKTIMA